MIDSVWEALAVFLAGMAAATFNTIVGSGTLVTFPTLLACGLPAVTANVSNTIGLVPGSVIGAWGYRRELRGQGGRLRWLAPASLVGGVLGSVLLLVLPSGAFDAIVPALIAIGVLLVVFGPRIERAVRARGSRHGWVWAAVAGAGAYGGYFGAAQGVLLMAILGIGVEDDMQRHNATKNVLAAIVNGVAAVVFIVVAHVDWRAVLLVAAGAVVGGLLGASIGRRLPAIVLRAVIVVVGVAAIVALLV